MEGGRGEGKMKIVGKKVDGDGDGGERWPGKKHKKIVVGWEN
jgi:hypothetical protein